ncbi:MAG: hypothetical protein WAZ40_01480 [Minisyncoccia bacterium]
MKIAGIALMWVGALYLLKNVGLLTVIDWNIIWPVAVIILGVALKHNKHDMTCAMGKCGACGKGGDHKCEGGDCGTCKK